MRYVRQAAVIGLFVAMPLSALAKPGPLTIIKYVPEDAVAFYYDSSDGSVYVRGNNVIMTSLQLESKSSAFNPQMVDPSFRVGPFDVATESKMFTLRTDGVRELALGPVLPPGLSPNSVWADLLIDGSLLPSGTFSEAPGGGPYWPVIPEPSGSVLMLLACVVVGPLLHCRARQTAVG